MSDDKMDLPDTEEAAPEQAPVETPAAEPSAPAEAPQAAAAPEAQPAPEAAQAPAEAPATEQTMAPMTVRPQTPEQEAEQRTAENLKFGNDLATKKIAPKTYSDLYHDKGFLGKMGTIFGLMISGAGAGLTHQPNALLEMMNKEIERDLNAQKADQENKRNWYHLSLENGKNNAQNALTFAQAAETGTKADMDKFINAKAGVDSMSAYNDAANHATLGTIQSYQDMIDRMPMGEQKNRAQQFQDTYVVPSALAKIKERNLQTSQKKQLIGAAIAPKVKGNPPPTKGEAIPGKRYDAYNQGEYARRAALGRVLGDRAGAVPDAIPVSAQPEIDAQATDLSANRNTYADAVKAFDTLSKMEKAGQAPSARVATGVAGAVMGILHGSSSDAHAAGSSIQDAFEQERNTQRQTLIGQLARGNISSGEAERIVDSFLPNFLDNPKQREARFEQLKNHFTSQKAEEAPALKKFGLYYPAPKYNFNARKTGTTKEKAPAPVKEEQTRAPFGARGQE